MGTRKSAGRPRWILVASGTHLVARASGLTCHAVFVFEGFEQRSAMRRLTVAERRYPLAAMFVACLRRTIPHRAVFEHMQGHKLVRRRRFFCGSAWWGPDPFALTFHCRNNTIHGASHILHTHTCAPIVEAVYDGPTNDAPGSKMREAPASRRLSGEGTWLT